MRLHKHVPLMEVSPLEAIKNNVFGTYNMANCADKYNVKKICINFNRQSCKSNKYNGCYKRMCEMIIQAFNKKAKQNLQQLDLETCWEVMAQYYRYLRNK